MSGDKQARYTGIGLLVCFVVLAVTGLLSSGTHDEGDSIYHYLYAHYAFVHPQLLLDHWAKPLFTLLAAPFAAFGFAGIKLFNTLIAVCAAWFAYRSASILQWRNAFLVPLFIILSPGYFLGMYSGLTEPLFSLFLIAALFFSLKERGIVAAVLISFLPFIRTEGQIIMIVFTAYYICKKQYKLIPFLLTGNLVYGLAGYLLKGDWLWTFHENAYIIGTDNYGSGELLHYVNQMGYVMGFPLFALLLLGMLFFLVKFQQPGVYLRERFAAEQILIIYGCFLAYFTAHSIFWWQGWFHSFGMPRVMYAIIPLGGLICLQGFNLIMRLIPEHYPNVRKGVYGLLVALIAWFPFSGNKAGLDIPKDFQLDKQQQLLTEIGAWYGQSGLKGAKVYYAHQYFAFVLDVDPFDPSQKEDISRVLSDSIPVGSVVFWDDWYALVESNVALDSLKSRSGLELIREFNDLDPKDPTHVVVFRKK